MIGSNFSKYMAQPRAKTLQERFGFIDADLKKPEHDEMIRWLETNIEDVLMLVFNVQARPKDVATIWEPVVRQKANDGQIIGFVDLMAKASSVELAEKFSSHSSRCRVLFEAKTELESLGTLFRQIRMYQEGYIHNDSVGGMPFVIVCPDESQADVIRQQGLYFLRYDPKFQFDIGGV